MRHRNVGALWIQDVQDKDGTEFRTVLGTENPADLMTKFLRKNDVVDRLKRMGIDWKAKEVGFKKGLAWADQIVDSG